MQNMARSLERDARSSGQSLSCPVTGLPALHSRSPAGSTMICVDRTSSAGVGAGVGARR